MTLKRICGPYTILGFYSERVYGPKSMVHLVLKAWLLSFNGPEMSKASVSDHRLSPEF